MTATTINKYTFETRAGSSADQVEVMLFCGHYTEQMPVKYAVGATSALNYPIDGTFCHSCQSQTQFATFIDGEMQYLGES